MADSNSTTTYVYFIGAGQSPIKIGVSGNPPARLRKLQTAHYNTLVLHYTIECQSREHALELEAAFHRWYGPRRLNSEWFRVSLEDVSGDIQLLSSLSKGITVRQHASDPKAEKEGIRPKFQIYPLASFEPDGRVNPDYRSPFFKHGRESAGDESDD